MTQARSFMRLVLRSRVVRLVAGFCVVSALAFTLGQSAAAFRTSLARRTAIPLAPQTLERLAGAHGTTPTPPPTLPSRQTPTQDGFSGGSHHATPNGHFEAQPGNVGPQGKDKTHPDKHGHDGNGHDGNGKAAGDSSHGGLSHGDGNGAGSGAGNGSGSGGHGSDNGNGYGAGHQSGQDVGSHTGHGD